MILVSSMLVLGETEIPGRGSTERDKAHLNMERLMLKRHHQRPRHRQIYLSLARFERVVKPVEPRAYLVAEGDDGGEGGPVGVAGGDGGVVLFCTEGLVGEGSKGGVGRRGGTYMTVVGVVDVGVDTSLDEDKYRCKCARRRMHTSKISQKYLGSLGSPPNVLQSIISKNLHPTSAQVP